MRIKNVSLACCFKMAGMLCLLFVASCATRPLPIPPCQILPDFFALRASGHLKIVLTDQPATHTTLRILSPAHLTKALQAQVQKGTLVLYAPDPVCLYINLATPLDSIYLAGESQLNATFYSHPHKLRVYLSNRSAATIIGKNIPLLAIENTGSGSANVQGVRSPHLLVRGRGTGKITLCGHAQNLDVQLEARALLYAQNLLAYDLHIMTNDQALAFVYPTDALYAFANHSSHIFYYHSPRLLVAKPNLSANILKIAQRAL